MVRKKSKIAIWPGKEQKLVIVWLKDYNFVKSIRYILIEIDENDKPTNRTTEKTAEENTISNNNNPSVFVLKNKNRTPIDQLFASLVSNSLSTSC